MKYHPEIMYAKYHFVRHVGWHLKIKICIQKWAKIDQKVQNVKIKDKDKEALFNVAFLTDNISS